jgi:hypothetical protein
MKYTNHIKLKVLRLYTNKTVRYGITEEKQMLTMALSKYQQNYKEIFITVLSTRLQN